MYFIVKFRFDWSIIAAIEQTKKVAFFLLLDRLASLDGSALRSLDITFLLRFSLIVDRSVKWSSLSTIGV